MSGRALLILVGVMALPGMGWAQQTDYSAGKSPAQLFAGDCSACHKSPRGLAKGQDSRSLSDFLREHYTTRPENASALAAYLVGNPGPAIEPRQAESHGRKGRAATANAPAPAPAPAAEAENPKPAEELSPFERLFGRVPSEPEKSTPVIAVPEEGAKPAAEPDSRAKPARAAKPDRKQKRKPSEAAAHPPATEAAKPGERPAEAGKDEAGKSEANKEDAAKAGAAEGARAERMKAEAARAKADAAKAEAAKEAASKAEAAKEAAAKADAAKADAAKAEAAKAEAAKLRSYATGGEEAKPAQSDAPGAQPQGGEAKPAGTPPG